MADYPELKHIISFEYEAGRFINEPDIAQRAQGRVIGAGRARAALSDRASNPIGTYIKISGVYFEVVGVTKTLRSGQQGDRDANTIFVPFTTLKTAFNMGDRVGFFALTAKPGTDGPELEQQVRETLSRAPPGLADRRARDRLVQHVRGLRPGSRRSCSCSR